MEDLLNPFTQRRIETYLFRIPGQSFPGNSWGQCRESRVRILQAPFLVCPREVQGKKRGGSAGMLGTCYLLCGSMKAFLDFVHPGKNS